MRVLLDDIEIELQKMRVDVEKVLIGTFIAGTRINESVRRIIKTAVLIRKSVKEIRRQYREFDHLGVKKKDGRQLNHQRLYKFLGRHRRNRPRLRKKVDNHVAKVEIPVVVDDVREPTTRKRMRYDLPPTHMHRYGRL